MDEHVSEIPLSLHASEIPLFHKYWKCNRKDNSHPKIEILFLRIF